jgi:hypothetical protein
VQELDFLRPSALLRRMEIIELAGVALAGWGLLALVSTLRGSRGVEHERHGYRWRTDTGARKVPVKRGARA